jgi:hypothetical protein
MTETLPFKIYAVQHAGTNWVKIGYTQNVVVRVTQLQVGNPRELTVVGIIGVIDRSAAREIERRLHRRYAAYCASTATQEWFELPDAELADLCWWFELHNLSMQVRPEVKFLMERPSYWTEREWRAEIRSLFGVEPEDVWKVLQRDERDD